MAKTAIFYDREPNGFPWRVIDENGKFKEGHSSLPNALRAKPEAKVDGEGYRRYLDELAAMVEGRLIG